MTKIKFIASSAYLSMKLLEIDFQNDHVVKVSTKKDTVLLHTQIGKVIELNVKILNNDSGVIRQEDRRWDWVRSLVGTVDKQPVVIEVFKDTVNVIFQY